MKIVNAKKFLAMPPNTLFSKYEPCCFDDIQIKQETCGTNDFLVQEISSAIRHDNSNKFNEILEKAEITHESIDMDFDITGRDGCFDDDQLFAVWENKDIDQLIEKLKKCKTEVR